MKFEKAPLEGAFLIDLDTHGDERGFFARLFCREEFAKRGLKSEVFQANDSYSAKKGTLRGMHYQIPPFAETKLVRCIAGEIYDVIIDIRPDSATYKQSFGAKLTQENRRMMFVPEGFAHGFLTLTDHSEVIYLVTAPYSKEHERGIRWNDPSFSIQWPELPLIVSEKDQNHPDFL
ncbi:MAG: dTDP-4-dehydrorhamnose 3,5-epimerase [Waddliaceae bacterium]